MPIDLSLLFNGDSVTLAKPAIRFPNPPSTDRRSADRSPNSVIAPIDLAAVPHKPAVLGTLANTTAVGSPAKGLAQFPSNYWPNYWPNYGLKYGINRSSFEALPPRDQAVAIHWG